MKKITFLSLLFMLLITACSDDSFNDPIVEEEQPNMVEDYVNGMMAYSATLDSRERKTTRAKTKVKTLKISTEGTISLTPMGLDCENGLPLIFREVNGVGNCTHLGLNTITLTYYTCGDIPITRPEGYQIAANGDSLYTRLTYAGLNEEGVFIMEYEYYDGSGRFETLVDGYAILYPTIWPVDPFTLGFTNYGNGWIEY